MNRTLTARAAWWVAAAALLAAFGACALASPASASSYSGSGDWSIDLNATEVVTNETISVSGFLLVNGSLELVNSSLTIEGRLPPLQLPPSPRREAAKAYINGSLILTNSTLTFYVPYIGINMVEDVRENSPVGLRVGPTGNVTLRDFDNDSATPEDGSFLTAYGDGAPANGSYSVFQPGSHFTMLNSSAELLGFRGFPGFEFNGSIARIEGSWFNNSHNATVFNNCDGIVLANLTLTNVEQPLSIRGGTGHRFFDLNISGFVVGIQLTGASDIEVTDMVIHDVVGQINYAAWPTPGTAFALNNTSGVTVRRLAVQGNLSDPSYEFVRLIEARSSSDLRFEDVNLGEARGLGFVTNARNVTLEHVIAQGFIDGLTLTNVSDFSALNSTIVGDAPWAIQATVGVNYAFVNYSAGVRNTLWLIGVSNVVVAGADLNATQVGFRAQDGANFDLRGVGVRGVGTGIFLANVTHFFADRPQVEFAEYGIEVAFSRDIVVAAPTLVGAPGATVRRPLFLTFVSDVAITTFDFQGACDNAGVVLTASNLTIDGFSARTCGEGLDISSATGVFLRDLVVSGAWNGTGLSLSSSSDAWVDNVDASGAWGYAVAIGAVDRLQMTRIDGRGGGGGGLVMIICRNVAVSDADFSGSTGTAVAVFNASGPVSLLRVNASYSRIGVELLGSPGVSLQDLDVSHNQMVGVDVDPYSPDVGLRNLTVIGNGGNGLFVDANRSVFEDGNISSNGGGGVEAGYHVRLDWTIRVAGSISNDTLHLKGILLVLGGATFDAQDATVRIDEGTSIIDPLPPGRIEVRGSARFTGVTLHPLNGSRAYGVVFGPVSVVALTACTIEGAARTDALSVFSAAGLLTIQNCTFTGWWRSLVFTGTDATVVGSTFTDNGAGPEFRNGVVVLTDVVSELAAGDGLTLANLSAAFVQGGRIQMNSGTGIVADQLSLFTLTGLNLSFNLGGGALVSATPLVASNVSASSNLLFAFRVTGGQFAIFTDCWLDSNTGSGIFAHGTQRVELWRVEVTGQGGNGLELEALPLATVDGGFFMFGGAAGVLATDLASLLLLDAVFVDNAGPALWMAGATVANATYATFTDAALDAVLVDGSADLTVWEARVDGLTGRVRARGDAHAYIVNSSFSGFNAEDRAVIDVAWHLRVTLLQGSGAPAVGALVQIANASGVLLVIVATVGQGAVGPLVVMEKTVFASGRQTLYTPHRVEAGQPGQGQARKNITVDRYRDITLRLDDTAPEVSITVLGTKGQGAWISDSATVTLEASDGGGFGLFVRWRLSGGAWQELQSATDFVSAVFVVATEGDSLIEYLAGDGAGNNASLQSAHVLVDLVPPTAVWLTNATGSLGRNLTLAWGGSDGNGSGITGFDIGVSFEGGAFSLWRHADEAGSAPFTGAEGDYTFRLTARDASGRMSQSVLLHVEVAYSGTLRLAVVGPGRSPVGTASVEVVGANQTQTGAGIISFSLAEGSYQVIVRAPGYQERTLTVNITAGNTTDLGEVAIAEVPVQNVPSGAGPLLAVLALAAVGGAAALFLIMRSAKRRAGEEKEAAERPPPGAP